MKGLFASALLALLCAASAHALPPPANACNTPAAAHNPHCLAPTTGPAPSVPTTPVPAPGTLLLLGSAVAALYLRRRLGRG